jgi:hypothetical protein
VGATELRHHSCQRFSGSDGALHQAVESVARTRRIRTQILKKCSLSVGTWYSRCSRSLTVQNCSDPHLLHACARASRQRSRARERRRLVRIFCTGNFKFSFGLNPTRPVALAAAACSGLSRVAKTHGEGAGHRFRMFGSLFRAAPAHVQLPAKCQAKNHTRGLHRSQTHQQMQDNKKPYKDTCTASGNRSTVGAPYVRARYTRAGREGRVARPAYAQLDRRGAGKQQ